MSKEEVEVGKVSENSNNSKVAGWVSGNTIALFAKGREGVASAWASLMWDARKSGKTLEDCDSEAKNLGLGMATGCKNRGWARIGDEIAKNTDMNVAIDIVTKAILDKKAEMAAEEAKRRAKKASEAEAKAQKAAEELAAKIVQQKAAEEAVKKEGFNPSAPLSPAETKEKKGGKEIEPAQGALKNALPVDVPHAPLENPADTIKRCLELLQKVYDSIENDADKKAAKTAITMWFNKFADTSK